MSGQPIDVAGIFRKEAHDCDRLANGSAMAGAVLTFDEVRLSIASQSAIFPPMSAAGDIIDRRVAKGMAQLCHKAADFQVRVEAWKPREIDAAFGSDCTIEQIFGSAREGVFVYSGGKAEKH